MEIMEIYEIALSYRATYHAHGLSNAGSEGNRTGPRRQLLADGTLVDAISGKILKHYHAKLMIDQFKATGLYLCPACQNRDGRRAGALVDHPDFQQNLMAQILRCPVCDSHGFLITSKNSGDDDMADEKRDRSNKSSLIEFSFGLAVPGAQSASQQLFTRRGSTKEDGQMLFTVPVRSADYGFCVRYTCAGVGIDSNNGQILVADPAERRQRHRIILEALADLVLSPCGAMTGTLLPHLTGLTGAIAIRITPRRAPLYSPLEADFIARLMAMASATLVIHQFQTVDEFNKIMEEKLIADSIPFLAGGGDQVATNG